MRPETKEWLRKSEDDLAAARILFEHGLYSLSAFHAQQAAEKALKALYIEKFGEFPPKTHSIVVLIRQVGLYELERDGDVLTRAYFASRYPDVGVEYSRQDAVRVLESSANIVKKVKEVIQWV